MLIPRGTLIGGKEKKKTHTNYCIAGYNSVVKGKKSGTKPPAETDRIELYISCIFIIKFYDNVAKHVLRKTKSS